MKKMILPLLLILILFCGCAEISETIELEAVSLSDVEAILTSVAESIDWEQLQVYTEAGAKALVEKYPSLRVLADSEQMKETLKDKGLALTCRLLESTEPEVQENARKLGAIIKILYPELTEDVDKVLEG